MQALRDVCPGCTFRKTELTEWYQLPHPDRGANTLGNTDPLYGHAYTMVPDKRPEVFKDGTPTPSSRYRC